MDIQFNSLKQEKDHIGVIFCDHNCKLIGFGKKLDQISKKYISKILSSDESFKLRNSKNFDYITIHQPENIKLSKLYVFKLKKFKEYSVRDFQVLGGHIFSLLSFYRENKVILYPDGAVSTRISFINSITELLTGFTLASYRFDKYKKKDKDKNKKSKKQTKSLKFKVSSSSHTRLEKNYINVKAISEGVTLTRNLVTEPPNIMTPPEIAKNAVSLEDYGDPAIFYSDIVINSLYETSINISKLFSGYKYEVIRPDVKAFSTLPKKKIINTSTYNLLICFGGTDPNKFMFRIPSILDILNDNLNGHEKLNVKLIYSIGEDNKVDNMIKNYDKLNVFSLSHTSVIAKELYESDIILCGNGRMIYEATLLNNIVISIPQNSRESTHTFCRDMPGHKQLPVFSEVTDDEIVSGILDSLELLKSDNDDLKDKIRMQIINEIKNGTSRVLELIDNV